MPLGFMLVDNPLLDLMRSPFSMILVMVVVFYVLLIRPQQQQRKKTQEMLANLKTGDRVVTSGGVYGTVAGFRDSVVQLQVAAQVKIEVARSAIQGLQPGESNGSEDASQELEKNKKK
ncbi:MAG TPA: preprotein translocase subunit YajC [Terriglobia bacterium]|nr:preprotein translocase subunit YajC [Terriglobia bacterium]